MLESGFGIFITVGGGFDAGEGEESSTTVVYFVVLVWNWWPVGKLIAIVHNRRHESFLHQVLLLQIPKNRGGNFI